MNLAEVVQTWAAVKSTRKRNLKRDTLAATLAGAGEDLPVVAAWLSGEMRQGRIGIGYAALSKARKALDAAPEATRWTVSDVDDRLTEIKNTQGAGSKAKKLEALEQLLRHCTYSERIFLVELLSGAVRQGASEGVLLDAIAVATQIDKSQVRRAFMLAGDMPGVVMAAFRGGERALDAFRVEVFRPLRPMLATPSDTPEAALSILDGEAFVDRKLDGVRVQIHRDGEAVRVFTRHLHDVTGMVPEVAQVARSFPWDRFVVDGEAIALRDDGAPLPFQTTMRRFGRKADVGRLRLELPLTTRVFDALLLGKDETIDWTAAKRFEALEALPAPNQVRRARVTTEEEVVAFYEEAVEAGHEGVMVKAVDAPYQAGSRGKAWLKVKPAHTLDLVVLAAEWGSGRRRGWLSNLHLGARDPKTGGFVMLGKTFKGLTDALLTWQTEKFQSIEVERNEYQVFVRPELVVEIAFNDVQVSPHYPGGVALRFARVKRYREDKSAEEADTIDTVRALLPISPHGPR